MHCASARRVRTCVWALPLLPLAPTATANQRHIIPRRLHPRAGRILPCPERLVQSCGPPSSPLLLFRARRLCARCQLDPPSRPDVLSSPPPGQPACTPSPHRLQRDPLSVTRAPRVPKQIADGTRNRRAVHPRAGTRFPAPRPLRRRAHPTPAARQHRPALCRHTCLYSSPHTIDPRSRRGNSAPRTCHRSSLEPQKPLCLSSDQSHSSHRRIHSATFPPPARGK